ncbi:MAG: ATP-binding protein [Phycisphaerales bacterium]
MPILLIVAAGVVLSLATAPPVRGGAPPIPGGISANVPRASDPSADGATEPGAASAGEHPQDHAHAHGTPGIDPSRGGWTASDPFTNRGRYMPRLHCLQTEEGGSDWLWSLTLIGLGLAVLIGYLKIYRFFLRSYLAEKPEFRNHKLMDLANIFLWCGVCGYFLSALMFFWPGYRLMAICLGVLLFFTLRFIRRLGDLTVSLAAPRIKAELESTLADANERLRSEVAARTAEANEARAVAERAKVEAELARDAAEEANQAKSQFVASMSHEIRTPMNAILGYAELLGDVATDDVERDAAAATIQRNGRHLIELINDILDVSKIEAGSMSVERVACCPRTVIEDVVSLLHGRASEQGLLLCAEALDELPSFVVTDPTRLRQILVNLVGNALKFTAEGEVRIVARVLASESGSDAIEVRVRDTGIGLEPDQLESIFDAFRQADASTTRRYGGTGLGLSISRTLAEMLGGGLSVESEAGMGSTFILRIDSGLADGELPADVARPEAVDANAGDLATMTGRVAIVDDGIDNRRLFGHLLRKAGLNVDVYEDGRSAIDALVVDGVAIDPHGAPAPDMILLDLQMPEIDGHETVRRLRAAGWAGPVIALTAHALSEVGAQCREDGFDDVAHKPISRSALLELCRTWLARGDAEGRRAA